MLPDEPRNPSGPVSCSPVTSSSCLGRGAHEYSSSDLGKRCFIFLSAAVYGLPQLGVATFVFINLHASLRRVRPLTLNRRDIRCLAQSRDAGDKCVGHFLCPLQTRKKQKVRMGVSKKTRKKQNSEEIPGSAVALVSCCSALP